jgi:hypothetical protein
MGLQYRQSTAEKACRSNSLRLPEDVKLVQWEISRGTPISVSGAANHYTRIAHSYDADSG